MIHSTENRAVAGSRVLALGLLLAALVAAMLLAARPAHATMTFTVNSTGDAGDNGTGDGSCYTGFFIPAGPFFVQECTLRAAIQEANATTGTDTINFNIPTAGVATIVPASALPTITGPVTIDGYSQPGAQPNTPAVGNDAVLKIELSGKRNANSTGQGLRIGAANSTVKGLAINNWGYGIYVAGSTATGNKVTGNHIGTDASATTQYLGNLNHGVYIVEAPNNTIGGTTAAERNVISGNEGDGVQILRAGGNKVMGNYIGTDASGTKDLGNGYYGVYLHDAPNNTIGGTTGAGRNVISGNNAYGVLISGPGATGNKVEGNYVGTDKNGTNPLGNTYCGVSINNGSNNIVGGTTAGARNITSYNGLCGVAISGDTATGNRVLSNSIFANVGLGINLNADDLTANDPADPDTGPNNLQNFPVITSASSTTVRGKLDSTPNKTFTVQFFSNPSGTAEGKSFIGQRSVTTDAGGNVSFAFSPAQKVGVGRTVTATATSPEGNTSEFSAARSVATR